MPFTLSHTAASLPFLNKSNAVGWKPALIFGTMAPDLLFPIPYYGERGHTHSIKGLFALDVPFAFLFAVVWVFLLSGRLSRLPGLALVGKSDPSMFSVPMSLAGALIGAMTHLTWDMFTHYGSPLLNHPVFFRPLLPGHPSSMSLQSLLWLGNSILGLALVIWWVRKMLHLQGSGIRVVFLSGPWCRILASFILPYFLILARLILLHPVSRSQAAGTLANSVSLVRVSMIVSFLLAIAVAWWETRERRAPENA